MDDWNRGAQTRATILLNGSYHTKSLFSKIINWALREYGVAFIPAPRCIGFIANSLVVKKTSITKRSCVVFCGICTVTVIPCWLVSIDYGLLHIFVLLTIIHSYKQPIGMHAQKWKTAIEQIACNSWQMRCHFSHMHNQLIEKDPTNSSHQFCQFLTSGHIQNPFLVNLQSTTPLLNQVIYKAIQPKPYFSIGRTRRVV